MVVRHKCSEREKWVTQTNKTMLEYELQCQIMQANQFHVRTRIINKQHWQIMLAHQFHLRPVLIYCLPSSIHRLRTSWFGLRCLVHTWNTYSRHHRIIHDSSIVIDRASIVICRLFIYSSFVDYVCLFVVYVFCLWGAISNVGGWRYVATYPVYLPVANLW